ncbi:MAG: hypothetical protein EA350_15040 [Gemmatimonadales bacterium]|nr:MAG: hypothetical protein EA350_15040 [Gemmatimonadales bacterium]
MTWPGQVVHVVRKDLARARWLVLGWTVLVALLTLQIVVPAMRAEIPLPAGAILLFLLGAGFAAWLVQEDGPHREGTFWPGLPLAPGAVLAGKVVVAFGIGVGIPLVGQLVTLLAFPVPAAELPWLLARSSVTMGAGITLGLVLGSVTRDLRMAAGLFIGTVVAMLAFQAAISLVLPQPEPGNADGQPGRGWFLLFGPLGAMLSGLFLLFLYRRGRVDRAAQGLGALLAFGCIPAAMAGASLVESSNERVPSAEFSDLAASEASASLVEVMGLHLGNLDWMPEASSEGFSTVRLEVSAGEGGAASPGVNARTWVEPVGFRLVNARGEVEVARAAQLFSVRWGPNDPQYSQEPEGQPSIGLPMTRPDAEGLLAGTLQVEVQGFLVTRELRRLPPIALVPGEGHASPGLRVTVLEPSSSSSTPDEERGLRIRVEQLADRQEPHPQGYGREARVPLGYLVEVRTPGHESPTHPRGGTAWGGGRASFLLAGVPRLDVTMEPRPRLPLGGTGTVSIGIWEHVRSEPVVFRVPAELITLMPADGARIR